MSNSNPSLLRIVVLYLLVDCVSSFSKSTFVGSSKNHFGLTNRSESNLKMVDGNVLAGVAIGVGGFAAGVGALVFAESQGERSKERGGGLSENMSTMITGKLMEDVEVSSVEDLGSLTSQLEEALKASGGTTGDELEMTEAEKERIREEAEDGW